MTEARRYLVSGRVQGVGFRAAARERARALGLAGWVRNLRDGRVEAHAEGSPEALQAFARWLARGPQWARVDGVAATPVEAEACAGFEFRPTV